MNYWLRSSITCVCISSCGWFCSKRWSESFLEHKGCDQAPFSYVDLSKRDLSGQPLSQCDKCQQHSVVLISANIDVTWNIDVMCMNVRAPCSLEAQAHSMPQWHRFSLLLRIYPSLQCWCFHKTVLAEHEGFSFSTRTASSQWECNEKKDYGILHMTTYRSNSLHIIAWPYHRSLTSSWL